MKYFDQLPKVLMTDKKGVSTLYTNLMARASIIKELLNNPVLFYSYDIQDGDTPEIVADKFYGDGYRFWLILFANEMLDPQWDWPLNSTNFNVYLDDKYQNFDPYTTIYEYQKIVSIYDTATKTTTVEKFSVDEDTYDNLLNSTNTYNFPSSSSVVTISKNIKTYFEYEVENNERKRSIKLLKKEYATQIENELKSLMGT